MDLLEKQTFSYPLSFIDALKQVLTGFIDDWKPALTPVEALEGCRADADLMV